VLLLPRAGDERQWIVWDLMWRHVVANSKMPARARSADFKDIAEPDVRLPDACPKTGRTPDKHLREPVDRRRSASLSGRDWIPQLVAHRWPIGTRNPRR
jgi:hypothetical protein